ncbi:MAG: DUF362 domain-containing protein [Promethearchaeota archaeon]|jgi:uncharacterized protein (DUF362 family)
MSEKSDIFTKDVAIIKGNTPQECVVKGIDLLGGISNFIKEGDNVFIKFNLNLPFGFPINTNMDVITSIISLCKEAGAKKIRIGSFPLRGISIEAISQLLHLEEYFNDFGAELIFLDNSNMFNRKNIKKEQLEKIGNESSSTINIHDEDIRFPKVILESDKVISVNQIKVNPLFKLNLSILNSFSSISPKYQAVSLNKENKNENLSKDLYRNKLTSKVIDVFSIKKPELVINDLYYILEGAGPYVFKDSILTKTNLMSIGNDTFAVDTVTLNLLNVEVSDYGLFSEMKKMGLESTDLQNINILGENLEDVKIEIEFCEENLEKLNIKNFDIKTGKLCSGCYESAYYLLNFTKTNLTKDLKYNPGNVFLIGEKPPNPVNFKDVIIFGDCAINSTRNSEIRKIIMHSDKNILSDIMGKIVKKAKKKKKPKVKEKTNKRILELPGCPPPFTNSLNLIKHYYKKSNTPNLNFNIKLYKLWSDPKTLAKLKAMGVI